MRKLEIMPAAPRSRLRAAERIRWEPWSDGTSKEWDRQLLGFAHWTWHQLHAWGEHRRSAGWTPLRFVARDGVGAVVAMAQVLGRAHRFGVARLWSAGGPVGDVSAWNADLWRLAHASAGSPLAYFRFQSSRPDAAADRERLQALGWTRSRNWLRSGRTMVIDLGREFDDVQRGFSRSFRRNLARAEHSGLRARRWGDPDSREIAAAFRDLESAKRLPVQYTEDEIASILEHLGERVALYRCDDANGRLLSLRGALLAGPLAWDLFSVTPVRGRESGASSLAQRELLGHCSERGVRALDLMGITVEGTDGVSRFKRSMGGVPVEQLGEWERSSSPLLCRAANLAVRRLRSRG